MMEGDDLLECQLGEEEGEDMTMGMDNNMDNNMVKQERIQF